MKHLLIFTTVFSLIFLSCLIEGNENDQYYENPWFTTDTYNISDYPYIVKQNGQPFKIVQFSDTQLEVDYSKVMIVFNTIEQAITDNQPDLLIFTGDNVSGEDNNALGNMLISFLDTFTIPYALVMGNHDGEGRFDNVKMEAVFASGKHSLFNKGPDNIHGTGNYAINIKTENDDLFYTLILLDSNRYRTYRDRNGYDYIYPDQIAYYEWLVKGVSKLSNGEVFPSLVFFHIPLPEINDIKLEIEANNPEIAADIFRETPCPPETNTGMFSKMKELGSTKAVVFGHDHVNLLDYEYQGIKFVYGLKTGTCSYYNNDRLGYTIITIGDDKIVDVQFKNYNIE